jgi:hypothetical protein
MKMNTARLEIFADDLDTPPHLSRSIPAALDGLIDYKEFQEFADELDVLLESLDADHQRFRNRWWWVQYGYIPWMFGVFVLSPYYPLLYVVCFLTSVVYIICVWLYATHCLKGPKTAEEIVREIRSLCEVMTNGTPHISFHPIFREVPAGSRTMESIINIDVSISENAFVAVTANTVVMSNNANNNIEFQSPVIAATSMKATCDYQQLKVV